MKLPRLLCFLLLFSGGSSIFAQPVASFKASPTSGCNPLKVDFENTSKGAVSYLWKFGNGNESTLSDPAAVYNNSGTFSITLVTWDSLGRTDTFVQNNYITVFQSPEANFSKAEASLCVGDSVHFTDGSTPGDGGIISWKWDFGDGGTSIDPSPVYRYTMAGTYDVTLAVVNDKGCQSSYKNVRFAGVNKLPTLSFTSSPDKRKCKAPLDVQFTPSVTGKAPLKYNWNFGDGKSSTAPAPRNLYGQSGDYGVSLAVTDANGCIDSLKKPGVVRIKPPTADFKADPLVICPGTTVNFTNLSDPLDGTGSFDWDFGNGNSATSQDAQVVYSKAGKYAVTLKHSWDGCTATETKTNYILVHEAPEGKIMATDTAFCRKPGDSVSLTIKGSNIGLVSWYHAENFAARTKPGEAYLLSKKTNGKTRIIAYLESPEGCKGEPDEINITIRGPIASIQASPASGCIPFTGVATWAGSGTSPIVSYNWSGISGAATNGTYNFNKTTFGQTPLRLQVTDQDGCTDSASIVIDGGLKIVPVLVVPPKVCRAEKFWIYNYSSIRNPDTVRFSYIWNMASPLPLDIVDSTKKALLDSPETVGFWSFEANSHGCITKSVDSPMQKTKIMGPKLDGKVKAICNSDTLIAKNQSTVHTSTYWRYRDENQNLIIDPTLNLKRLLSQTRDLWLFAFNDTNNCADSVPYEIKTDPTVAKFTMNFDCASRTLKTTNQYPGLNDDQFTWTITNSTLNKSDTYSVRNLDLVLEDGGDYRIELAVNNPAFVCTPGATNKLLVPSRPSGKPAVEVDRLSCYPVKLNLKDPNYNFWPSAVWTIDGQNISDSASDISLEYISNTSEFSVSLRRIDPAGCAVDDTFDFTVKGPKAEIAYSQSGNLCNNSVLSFKAIAKDAGNSKLTYFWDFGHKTSTLLEDTVLVKGYRALDVTLRITDDKGCASEDKLPVVAKNGSPIARFTVSDTAAACPPLDVFFTDLTDASQYPIVTRYWDFGDNTYSNKEQPGKLYIYPGKYSVSLKVTNSVGCVDSFRIPNLVVVNGPSGTYSFDKKEGCTPLQLNLSTSLQGKIMRMEFDMGDGAVLDLGAKEHTYARPGIYIPRLIVVDSNNCRYSPEPKDTIRVNPNPIAAFDDFPACDNQVYDVHDLSDMNNATFAERRWIVDGIQGGGENPLQLAFADVKQRSIELRITTDKGCVDAMKRIIHVYSIHPALSSDKSEYCLGETAFILDKSVSDTTILKRKIWLDNNLMPDADQVLVPANRRGKIPVMLALEDVLGCKDTLAIPVFLKVGDTLPTVPLTMYRTSVVDNETTETRFSQSQEPDFKQYKLYVWSDNQWRLKASSENLADTNLFAYGLNTLKTSYCHRISQQNYCDMETDSTAIAPHCTVEVRAVGDTNQSIVKWSHYSGWNEVQKYRIWRKRASEDIYQLLDSVPGNINSYIDSAVYCYVVYDYRIEAFERNGHLENSWSDTARAIPYHLLAVPSPEVWRTTVNDNAYTHTEWIMPVQPKFGVSHFSVYRYVQGNWELYRDNILPDKFDIDDRQTDVQTSTYTYVVQATDKCNTKSLVSNVGRSILLKVKASKAEPDAAELNWTPYIYWNEDVAEYQIERSIGGSEFVQIGKVSGETQTYLDRTLPRHCEKDFVYRITAVRNQPDNYPDSTHDVRSVSNHADFVPQLRFYIPNAFTPNDNSVNDGFRPDGIFYYRYDMKIYNRYGQKVYDNSECDNSWNGIYDGELAQDGVYAYHIKVWDLSGKEYIFAGTIHLLR